MLYTLGFSFRFIILGIRTSYNYLETTLFFNTFVNEDCIQFCGRFLDRDSDESYIIFKNFSFLSFGFHEFFSFSVSSSCLGKVRFVLRAEPKPTDSKTTVTCLRAFQFLDDEEDSVA